MWLAFVCRQNQDGTPWEPGDGDRVCSMHFLSGSKSDVSTDPDYTPSVKTSSRHVDVSSASSAVARFQRLQRRSMAAETALAEAEAMEKQRKRLLSAVMHDHGSLTRHDSERQEELIVKSPGLSELMCTCRHDYIISAEIGVFRIVMLTLSLITTVIILL